jgi:chromosome segregation ATPase
MTPQEMERTITFMLEHQAQFDIRLEKLLEQQAQLTVRLDKLAESVEGLHKSQATLTESMLGLAGVMQELMEAQKITEDHLRETGDRLNALINVVEKHITGPDHGRPPSKGGA